MANASSHKRASSIRITTELRTGHHPDGTTVSVKILKPLTPTERQAGKKDAFKAWTRVYGDGTSRRSTRGHHPSDWWDPKPKHEKIHADVDKQIQLDLFTLMKGDFERMAVKLVSQNHIGVSDKEFYKGLMFDACRDAYPKYDPAKRSLRGFMKDVIKKWRSDLIDYLNSGKRKEDFTRLSVRQNSVSDEFAAEDEAASTCDGSLSTETINEEELPHPRSIHELEFNMACSDLENMCDPDEKLALHILYEGGTVEELASKLRINPASARRNIVGSLQLKVDFCFGFSEQHKLKFILKRR